MNIFSFSGKGNREKNEDYLADILLDDQTSIHIVADGMGGYLHGEIASELATESIVEFISLKFKEVDIYSIIQQAINYANEKILFKSKLLQTKLGTTIAGVFIRERIAYMFWIGDVQIQHFMDNELLFVSENHSLVNEMKKNGIVSSKDIDRYKNIVTKSLSGSPLEENFPIVELHLKQGDTICISSDGLYNSLEISNLINKNDDEINQELKKIEYSNEDNFTLVRITI